MPFWPLLATRKETYSYESKHNGQQPKHVISIASGKQDKELAQFALTPIPIKSEVGDPRCTFGEDSTVRMDAFATQISPALFMLLEDAVFKEHVRLKTLVNKEERKIIKATGKERDNSKLTTFCCFSLISRGPLKISISV